MSLTFSVITPSYNQGRFIERTIQSVFQQHEVELDYMVCDGGSTDETVSILRQYEDRLRWVSEPDGGQAAAVNKGIDATSGDIIAWINSDDVYLPAAFSKVQHAFETRPDVDVIYGDACHIDCDDQFIEPYPAEEWDYERLKDACILCQPAVFFRRKLVADCGALNADLQLSMDYELWLRYGQQALFLHLPEVLAHSRFYPDTKTSGQSVAVHREINDMMKAKFSVSPEKWVLTYAHVVLDEHKKNASADISSSNAALQVEYIHLFCWEAFKGAFRWRKGRLSFKSVWMMLGWLYRVYRNRVIEALSYRRSA
jgi:glycosyltransferase involved in cell wall biosynthesis